MHSLEPQPEGDVFENGEVRKKGIGLKDEADGPLIGGDARDVSAVETNVPRDRRQKTGNRPHRRGLAAARRARQGDELPLFYREVQPIDRNRLSIGKRQLFKREIGRVRHSGKNR
jgi:hypothetical protein